MSRWIVLVFFLVSCNQTQVVTGPAAIPVDVDPEIVQWVQGRGVVFRTPEAGTGFDDLAPLGDMVGDARIVSLGEATHGTREFFQMKHRILEFLVSQKGFTHFAIEATWPESNAINDFIRTGEGDPGQLLANLYFWTWNTEEVLAMIRWMRQRGVSFHGFDMQFPKMAMDNVVAYLASMDSATSRYVAGLYACFRPYELAQRDYRNTSSEAQEECRLNLERVFQLLATNRDPFEAMTGAEAFAHALQSARIAIQAENYFSSRNPSRFVVRDEAMAQNVKWIVEQAGPDAKVVLWAHNGHVSVRSRYGTTMGWHLRQAMGESMLIVGFSFYAGSFNARSSLTGPLVKHAVEPPPENSYSYVIRGADLPRVILDLRDMDFSTPATSWLREPLLFRSIGAVYDSTNPSLYFDTVILPEAYDLIVYFQDTSPSQLRGANVAHLGRAIR